jgi:hypothetical protein
MPETGRVVTASLPADLVSRLDEVAERMDRRAGLCARRLASG